MALFLFELATTFVFLFIANAHTKGLVLDHGSLMTKRNSDDFTHFNSEEEDVCSLSDSCTIENVTAKTITVRWPCCAGKNFDLISNPVGFSRESGTCNCQKRRGDYYYRPPQYNDQNEKEKTMHTADCFATFTDYCPYGEYQISVKSGEESCTLRQSTLPSAPEWVEKKAVGEDKIYLSWRNNYCADNKKPIYRISWTDPDHLETVEERTDTELTIAFLSSNTRYTITLRACDNERHKSDNKFCSENMTTMITTHPGTPSEPMNVAASATSSSSIMITWDPPDHPRGPIDGYEVVCRKGRRIVQNASVSGKERRSYLVTKLQLWTNYICAVQAFNINPDKKKLHSRKNTAETTTKPEKPSEPVNVNADEISSDQFLLSWQRPTTPRGPIDGYYLKVFNDRETTEFILSPSDHTHRFKDLSPGTEYNVSVSAFHYDIVAGQQNENYTFNGTASTITIATTPIFPSAPRDVKIVKVSSEEMLLKWKRPSAPGGKINGYVIKILTDEYEEYLEGSSLHHKLRNLSPKTNYSVAIFAYNLHQNNRLDGEQVMVNSTTKPDELSVAEAISNFKASFDDYKKETQSELSKIRESISGIYKFLAAAASPRETTNSGCLYPPCERHVATRRDR